MSREKLGLALPPQLGRSAEPGNAAAPLAVLPAEEPARGPRPIVRHAAHVAFVAAVVMADLASITAGVVVAALERYPLPRILHSFMQTPTGPAFAVLVAIVWVAVLSARSAYAPATLVSGTRQVLRVASAGALAWVAMMLFALWSKVAVPFESRLVMVVALPACLSFLLLERLLIVRVAARHLYSRLLNGSVLVLADSGTAAAVLAGQEGKGAARGFAVVRPLERFHSADARRFIEERRIREVIIAPSRQILADSLTLAFECLDAGASVRLVAPDFRGLSRALGVSDLPDMELRRFELDGPERVLKRILDAVGSACGLLLLAPLFVAIGIAIRLTSPGSVIFRQERIGRRGKPFSMYKFRTMESESDPTDYETYMRSFILEGQPAEVAEDGSEIFKPRSDPRVTRLGAWLRRLSLDELPQLWNVLRGEMSLVGPRPCLPCEWALYKPWQRRRLDITPGCTGLWQVAGRSRVCFEDMVVLDIYYAHTWTVLSDLRLIAQTIPVMLFGRGAY